MDIRNIGQPFDICNFFAVYREKILAHSAHFMSSIFRACKNISGLVYVEVTSPAQLMKVFANVEPCKSVI